MGMTVQPSPAAKDRAFLAELHSQISNRLAQQGHRYTKGRQQLVEVLARARQPMTLPDIVGTDPKMAQSSAYRNLDVLVRCGVIRRINSGGDYAHFELAEPLLGHHHHLICISCGNIEDIHLESDIEHLVDRNLSEIAARTGFTPTHHSLDLHGHCAHC
jgi:Fe2+ or Zn2+ uptake regulation protein